MKTTYTRAEVERLVSTIEADIRHAEAEEANAASLNLHGNALEWKARQMGLSDARVRVLTLLQS